MPPKPVVTVKAVYPPEAQAKALEGSVTVLADLDATGAVKGVQIAVSSGAEVLDDLPETTRPPGPPAWFWEAS